MNPTLEYIGRLKWWQLTPAQRQHTDSRIRDIVYTKHKGNRASVLTLVQQAIASERVPLFLIWRLWDEVQLDALPVVEIVMQKPPDFCPPPGYR